MGQITNPSSPGIQVRPIDRESGPGAGAGASGNRSIFLGLNAGLNSTADNLIVIGNASASAGVPAGAAGSTIVGVRSAVAANVFTNGPLTILGFDVMPALTENSGSVLIGDHILSLATIGGGGVHPSNNTIMGSGVLAAQTTIVGAYSNNVLLGANVMGAATQGGSGTLDSNVFIGASVANTANGVNIDNNVVIGAGSGTNLGNNAQNNNIIGANSATSLGGGARNNALGHGIVIAGAVNDSVLLGDNLQVSANQNVMVGSQINGGAQAAGVSNIYIGYNVGQGASADEPTANTYIFMLGVGFLNSGVTGEKMFLYGNMAAGTMVFGNSTLGVNRDMQGVNTFKVLNGNAGGVPPVGGGYFYSAAGALHWVGTAGTDTVVAPA